ncbi:hypothetical protein ACH4TX_27940 [Streptomyces sp. NPDC021098]|uniref:hypothetical protein n=1 Tax=unclassified Streptomyces TaxID=2593676 RepID=UPI0037A8C6E8
MRVRIVIALDVDPDAWAREYGVARPDVRTDVKAYFEEHAHQSYPVAEEIVTWLEGR